MYSEIKWKLSSLPQKILYNNKILAFSKSDSNEMNNETLFMI